jgi:hypothetical protein
MATVNQSRLAGCAPATWITLAMTLQACGLTSDARSPLLTEGEPSADPSDTALQQLLAIQTAMEAESRFLLDNAARVDEEGRSVLDRWDTSELMLRDYHLKTMTPYERMQEKGQYFELQAPDCDALLVFQYPPGTTLERPRGRYQRISVQVAPEVRNQLGWPSETEVSFHAVSYHVSEDDRRDHSAAVVEQLSCHADARFRNKIALEHYISTAETARTKRAIAEHELSDRRRAEADRAAAVTQARTQSIRDKCDQQLELHHTDPNSALGPWDHQTYNEARLIVAQTGYDDGALRADVYRGTGSPEVRLGDVRCIDMALPPYNGPYAGYRHVGYRAVLLYPRGKWEFHIRAGGCPELFRAEALDDTKFFGSLHALPDDAFCDLPSFSLVSRAAARRDECITLLHARAARGDDEAVEELDRADWARMIPCLNESQRLEPSR